MAEWFAGAPWSAYGPVVLVLAGMGALSLVQLLVADLAGILSRHRPGHPVVADHSAFLFRAVRAHANTNESLPAFLALAVVTLLVQPNPVWANASAGMYLGGRVAHMLCYYLGWGLARSLSFAASLLGLAGLAALVLWSLWAY